MNFVRKGPDYLFLRTEQSNILIDKLIKLFNGEVKHFSEALEQAREDETIAFVTPVGNKKTKVEDAINIIFIPDNIRQVLATIIVQEITEVIDKVDLGPGQMVMRIPEKGKTVIEEIQEFYEARSVTIHQGIDIGEQNDTVLSFTEGPIRTRINSLQLVKKNLLINRSVDKVHQELRRDAIHFITHGLDHSEWYELKINIYDNKEMYDLQYERLVLILSELEAGFILGETWTKDHAIALFSVIAYQIRLFTILTPDRIKKILMGLEYDNKGQRIADFDLYHKSDKIEWFEAFATDKKLDRVREGLKLREKIFSNITNITAEKIKKLEEKRKRK